MEQAWVGWLNNPEKIKGTKTVLNLWCKGLLRVHAIFTLTLAIRTSISDDWSSTGFIEAAAELEGTSIDNKIREKRDKERQKERAKVEKEKESDEGIYMIHPLI